MSAPHSPFLAMNAPGPAIPDAAPAALLPLFPLHSVLFPDGRLNLRIFEARYMDMIALSMREQSTFGICLIAEGAEVGEAAVPQLVGVEARVIDWDMSQPGMLGIAVRGERRFRILQHAVDGNGLLRGAVSWLGDAARTPLAERHERLLPLLRAIVADAGERVIATPPRFDDASWVGYRYAEVLPIPNLARQKLLELDDADMRLDIVQQFLADRELIR